MVSAVIILAIESSCDDTAAAVSVNDVILANVVAGQDVHLAYGGVVPELASRAHQQHIVAVTDQALKRAKVSKEDLDAIAFTKGPGLMGSLLVGASFAKGMALALDLPLIGVNHMEAHVLAHFIRNGKAPVPSFPFLCLTVSGGHTQIVLVRGHLDMEVIGETLDDAAGEAFDKTAKMLGLPYPGGPLVDRHAQGGNAQAFGFPHPSVPGYGYSFSGLKTSVLYFLRDRVAQDGCFIEKNLADICASVQYHIIETLAEKLVKAAKDLGIKEIAVAGGVSANSRLRERMKELAVEHGWSICIPKFEYCTDNAAMIAVAGYCKFLKGDVATMSTSPSARLKVGS